MRRLALAALIGCAPQPHVTPVLSPPPPPPPPPPATTLAAFETAWQATVACLYAADESLAALDPRDALAIADGRTRHDRDVDPLDPCHVGALAAAAPPALHAVAAELAVTWADAHGKHAYQSDYAGVATFAEALRDTDDARAGAGGRLPRLGSQRLPLVRVDTAARPLAPDVAAFGDRLGVVRGGDVELDPSNRRVLSPEDAVVDLPERSAADIEERTFGTGRDRARVRIGDRYSGKPPLFEVAESHDGGATWKTVDKEKQPHEISGSPRNYDFVTEGANPRWIHVGADGVVGTPVPITITSSSTCATAEVLWISLADRKAAWFDRAGHHGEVTGSGDGNTECAGRAMMKDFDLERCTTESPACEPALRLDQQDGNVAGAFVSDGAIVARAAGHAIVIVRGGARAGTTRVRLPEGVRYLGLVVRGDAPRLVVRAADGSVRFAQLP